MEPVNPPIFSFVLLHYFDTENVNRLATEVFSLFPDAEFIVVDNSLNFEPAPHLLPHNLQVLKPGYNSGFARGVNMGLRAAKGHFMVMVNQDVVGLRSAMPLFEKLDYRRPDPKIYGIRLLSAEGEYQQSIWADYPGMQKEWRASTFYSLLGGKNTPPKQQQQIFALHQQSGTVERCNGAFLVFHRNLVEKDDLQWGEDFFLYGEDVEWAWRCNRKGWSFYYDSSVSVNHIGSAASPDVSVKNLQVILSDFLFVAKAHGRLYTWFFLAFVALSSRLDLFLLARTQRRSGHMDKAMWANRKMKLYLVKKYRRLLLGKHAHSNPQKFLFNCYENDQAFAATLSNQG